MKYSKGYMNYHPMVEHQPAPSSSFGAAIVGLAFGMIFAAMVIGWVA